MTHADLTDAVRAAETLAPSSAERHGTYPNRSLAPGIERLADDSHRVDTRVHASGGELPGQDGCSPAPTPCPHCTRGTTTGPNGESWRCSYCGGSAVMPVQPPRAIPGTGTRRHA